LYKLIPGNVDKSFGLNVAKKVGVNADTIKIAAERANLMNAYI
jgi:DNA mismatch repair ATPase MutS